MADSVNRVLNEDPVTTIKRYLYDNYPDNTNILNDFANEIGSYIPSCSISGINKDCNGIHITYNCSSFEVNKEDIARAVRSSAKILIVHLNNIMNDYAVNNIRPYIDEICSIMLIRGVSFSIII